MKNNNKKYTDSFKKTKQYKDHVAALERFREMTEEEKFQTLVDADIVNQEGKLTIPFGGTVQPESWIIYSENTPKRRK